LIVRQSKEKINKLLQNNPNWKILDIGCSDRASKFATDVADIVDVSNFYHNKKFTLIDKNHPLPFKNDEFDFIICSHVIEHVEDIEFFIKELQRISQQGYIELPSRLEDNLVFVNKSAHLWWFDYDDDEKKLLYDKKSQILEPLMSVNLCWEFRKKFKESFIIQLYWKNTIEIEKNNLRFQNIDKISRFKIIKKFLSFYLRKFLKFKN